MRAFIIAVSVLFAASHVVAQWTPWQVPTPTERHDVTGQGETVTFSQVDLIPGMIYRVHTEDKVDVGDGGFSDARYYVKIFAVAPTIIPVCLKMKYDVASEDWFNSNVAPAQQGGYQSSHVYDALVTSRGVPLAFRFFDRESAPSPNGYYNDNSGKITVEVTRETPGIAVKYDTIDFGTVAVGQSKMLLDSIQGYGKGYQVENVFLTGSLAPFSAVSERTVQFGLKDATNEFQFTFAPTTTGPQQALFHIISSTAFGSDKDRIIVLRGNGGKAVVTSLTDTLDFGTIAVGTAKALDAILRNSGNLDAQVQSIVVMPSGQPFSANTLPVTVAQAAQVGLPITFSPLAVGPYFAAIDAKLDDGSTVRFYAKGNGGGAMVTSLTDTLDFGTIAVGTPKTLNAILENTGFLDAQVVSVQVTPVSAPFSASGLPLSVTKAIQTPLPITFTPPAVGSYFAAIDAKLDDGSTVRFYAKGNGGGAMITSLPDTLDFGSIGVSTSKALPETFQNKGIADATITSVQFTPASAAFAAAGFPIKVLAGGSAIVPINFTPTAVGNYFASADATLNDGTKIRFYVKGYAGQGRPFFTRDTLNFDTVIIGLSKVLTTTFLNKEDAPGTGGPITVVSSTNSNPEFSILGNPGPFTKDANSGEVYTVTFAPTTHIPNYGLHSGVFTLSFSDQGPKSVYFFGYDHLALEAQLYIDTLYYVVAGKEITIQQVLRSDLSKTLAPIRQLSESITYDPKYFELLTVDRGTIISGPEWTLNTALTPGQANVSIATTSGRFQTGGELLKLRFRAKADAPVGAFSYLPQIGVDFGGLIEPLASSRQGKITVTDICSPVRIRTSAVATYIEQNSPNPVTNSTRIQFSLGESADGSAQQVSLSLYDATGRPVKTLVDEAKAAGVYSVDLDASGLAPGVYTYIYRAGDYTSIRKLLVTR